MSGGSFNYLCYKDANDLFGYEAESDIESMVKFLSQLGYAEDAAKETANLLAVIRHARILVEVSLKRLNGVWHGAEWWVSNEYGEDGFRDTLEAYRAQLTPKELK